MKKWILIPLGLAAAALILGQTLALGRYRRENAALLQEAEQARQSDRAQFREALEALELALSKIPLCEEPPQLRACLFDIEGASRIAAACLNRGDLPQNQRSEAVAFLQRLSDCARSLMDKAAQGSPPNGDELTLLQEAREACLALHEGTTPQASLLSSQETQDNSLPYPVMIYDGPFSQQEQQSPTLGLPDEEGSPSEARMEAARILSADPQTLTPLGEEYADMGGWIFANAEERILISRRGLKPIWYLAPAPQGEGMLLMEQAQKAAIEFCRSCGIEADQVTWQAEYEGCAVFSLAPSQEGLILYPDLVKVKVSLQDGSILGLDARRYWKSHTQRRIPALRLTPEEARLLAPSALSVTECRPVWIADEAQREFAAWELRGSVGEDSFFLFIEDASGTTVDIFRQIPDLGAR